MAQDIRELFKNDQKLVRDKMPNGHEDRFLSKLEKALPDERKSKFSWYSIAASIVLLIGLSFGAYKYFQPVPSENVIATTNTVETKSLGDISPGLKKVEDYYMASINNELSKMKYTPETKDLFDSYIDRLNELNKEYERLSVELTKIGPNELTVNALIDNLKFRLTLLYRMRDQLKELNVSDTMVDEEIQSI